MQKFSPFLWFDDQAEAAAMFYTSVFERSRIVDILHYPDEGVGDERRVMSVTFELDGQTFVALNGGPEPRSPFLPRCHSSSIARRNGRSMRSGSGLEKAVSGSSADGCATNSV